MNIILFEKQELKTPGVNQLEKRDPRAVHLIKTLHKKAGDNFAAGIIGSKRGMGTIMGIDSSGRMSFALELNEEPPPRLPLHIGLGFNRPIQLRRILRSLSNLGCAEISIFGTDFGEKSYQDTTLLEDGGARAALIEGAAQARDTLLPSLKTHKNVSQFIESLNNSGASPDAEVYRIAADNIEAEGSFNDVPPSQKKVLIAVGSERGWSKAERELFRGASFHLLSLGKRALRSEVAAIAVCSRFIEGYFD